MKTTSIVSTLLLFIALLTPTLYAHQPVMDMAPRWEDGWGFQVRYERRASNKVLDGDNEAENPLGRKRDVNKTWLEGVYTFNRAVRTTFKIPWVQQSRTVGKGGKAVRQRGVGVGDLILGVPLKYYTNFKGGTQNFGFTPSIRLPTGHTSGDYPAGDGSTDVGFSFSYSYENSMFYHLYDAFYWINTDGKKEIHEGNMLGFDANVGIHPYHSDRYDAGIYVMADFRARYSDRGLDRGGDTGGTRLSLGPVVVLYYRNIMVRGEYRMPVYENAHGNQISYGNEGTVGIGITF